MYLRFIEQGTMLDVQEESSDQTSEVVYQATFNKLVSNTQFTVEGQELYECLNRLPSGARLRLTFYRGANLYTFTGKPVRGLYDSGTYLTIIEQLSSIITSNRRKYDRTEMRILVKVYGLPEENLKSGLLVKLHEPEFISETLDISASGLCLVSNDYLESRYEPYFLVEFSLGSEYNFLLPAKLLRKGNCPQTSIYRYDYGFCFLYDSMPDERKKLSSALLSAKLAAGYRR